MNIYFEKISKIVVKNINCYKLAICVPEHLDLINTTDCVIHVDVQGLLFLWWKIQN